MLLTIMIALLFIFILLGMEVAWAIGIACLGYLVLSHTVGLGTPFVLFSHQMTEGINGFALLAVPLFILAGELMSVTGITERLVRVATVLVGHRHGGLANVAVTANFIMSGVSGSALADAAATGSVLIPEMKRRNYPTAFAAAVIASSATVGPIIPPSILFVLLAAIVNLSVGRLFLAGVLPGVVMWAFMFALTAVIARRRGFAREARATGRERLDALARGILPLAAPVFIIGSIVFGVATPTEAAAVAVVYTVMLGMILGTVNAAKLVDAAGNTALLSAVVMLTVGTSQMFAWIAVQERIGDVLTSAILAVSSNPLVILFLINIMLLILGMPIEPLPLMLILGPILFPLLEGMGIDPIHFAVVMVLNLMIGMITPPVGGLLFVVSAIARVDMMEISYDAIPYMLVLALALLLITYFPPLTLWLPRLVFGG